MFNTIVVGTDGSEDAMRAVRAAAAMAKVDPAATVHVVTAFHPLTPSELNNLSKDLPDELRPLLRGDMAADSTLAEAKAVLEAAGVQASYHGVEGNPSEVMLDTIDSRRADLAIVGSRGHGATKRLLQGSVSTKVLHNATCAVLVIKSD